MDNQDKQIAHFKATCREHGLKITHQRLEIYRAIAKSNGHPSAEVLHKLLTCRMPMLSIDTVYRTLATFEEIGLVKRVETMVSQARFEVKKENHHHFFCDQCGQLMDFTWHSFDNMNLPKEIQGLGRIQEKNVLIHGICSVCLSKK